MGFGSNSTGRALAVTLSTLLALLATQALAHGDEHQKTTTSSVKEQKPWGIAGDAKAGVRTIRVSMNDRMRFTPETIRVRQGETVRFVVKNDGTLMHEFVLGTREAHEAHAALMTKYPNMEHDEPYMAHVAPGASAELVWTFNRAGEFGFACLIAGHYQAGMIGTVRVDKAAGSKL